MHSRLLKISKKRTTAADGQTIWNAKCPKTDKLLGVFCYQDRGLIVQPDPKADVNQVKRLFDNEFPSLEKKYALVGNF